MTRALVFVHYDRDGLFDDHVVTALRSYRAVADRLVVVSASAATLPDSLATVVDTFIPRENVGYDFCSWRAGLESLASVSAFDEVICVNDSVYGPLFDLKPALTDRRLRASDLWGMCLSEQGLKRRGKAACPHLQSWFFAMRRPILRSHAFRQFWNGVEAQPSKEDIIHRYEIGMSEHFLRAGFQMAGLYDARTQRPATGRDIWPHLSLREPARTWRFLRKACRGSAQNPSERFPDRLLDHGVPFVKVGLFRVNHYGLNVQHVFKTIGRDSTYDPQLIVRHLDRLAKWPQPARTP